MLTCACGCRKHGIGEGNQRAARDRADASSAPGSIESVLSFVRGKQRLGVQRREIVAAVDSVHIATAQSHKRLPARHLNLVNQQHARLISRLPDVEDGHMDGGA